MARVLITGARGFVGRWLTRELEDTGHEVIALEHGVDVRDAAAVASAITSHEIDAIAHLAAVAYGPDAAADAETAYSVAVGGTANVLEAVRASGRSAAVLVTGSAEIYGSPTPEMLPLTETSAVDPRGVYGLSKLAQESVAIAYATRYDMRVVVTRSFNHTGPGQRPSFVVPALARRILDVKRGTTDQIPVGNMDVRRDFSDVRDVVRAYRLLLDASLESDLGRGGLVANVCSGSSVTIRWMAEELCRAAGINPPFVVDPALVRPTEAPEIRGDHSRLSEMTAWRPERPLTETLREVWQNVALSPSDPALDRRRAGT
jgi:GDP-4-dehydro-6-deoxy-D-mannose reductase